MLVRHLTKNVKYHKRQNVYIYRRFLLFSRNTSAQKKRAAVFVNLLSCRGTPTFVSNKHETAHAYTT